jgi:hypothetical protein
MGGQVFVACVTLPVCLDHLTNTEKTVAQRMAEAGLALPAGG